MSSVTSNGRSLAEILTEMKDELQEFVQTRIELLKRELQEKLAVMKAVLPIASVSILFLVTSFVLFSLALVGLFAGVFAGDPYRWLWSFLIVGFLWLIIGGIAGLIALRQLTAKKLMPRRTISVLNDDKAWIRQEAKLL